MGSLVLLVSLGFAVLHMSERTLFRKKPICYEKSPVESFSFPFWEVHFGSTESLSRKHLVHFCRKILLLAERFFLRKLGNMICGYLDSLFIYRCCRYVYFSEVWNFEWTVPKFGGTALRHILEQPVRPICCHDSGQSLPKLCTLWECRSFSTTWNVLASCY